MNPIYKFELNRTTVNLLNPKTIVSGLLNTNNGSVSTSSIYQTSDFIPVTPGTNYKLCDKDTFTELAAAAACFYTANKTFISGSYGIANTPSNAAFLRVSFQGPGEDWGVFPSNVSFWSEYVTPIAYPVYKDDLEKDFEKESNQEFFRAKLSGNLSFVGPDYDWIVGRAFDFQFVITVFISYNAGRTWTEYWRGTFWKTDCEFDDDAKTVSVKPTVLDQYNDVLAGLDKEYNLIELAPEIVPVKADKRPMIQVYIPGQSVIGCFLSGMWWEQECEPVNESDTVQIEEQDVSALIYKYRFAKNTTGRVVEISGDNSPQLPPAFVLNNPPSSPYFTISNGTYTFGVYRNEDDPNNPYDEWFITRISDNMDMWYGRNYTPSASVIPYSITLTPVEGSGAVGNVVAYVHDISIYARIVCDTTQINNISTYLIPADDMVPNNRNYHRVIGYSVQNTIYFSAEITSTPNKWGLYQPGWYYQPPYLIYNPEFFPVARSVWGRFSIWFTFSQFDWITEESGRQPFTIRHAYPISSVISVLLNKIAPGITHAGTTDYSQFLYGQNLIGINQTLLITPKSNLVTAGYDQPAQKAPITLKNVLDMLRDCFRCYWFIDEQNRFRVEHIQYFRNGGSYSGSPVVGIDLTTQKVPRNGKEWAFARNQYKFDKPEMAARYQFGWMDDVTQLFDGYPIDIISKYVNPDNIEQIDVSKFTSDIDYILLNPGEISKDGFALLAGIATDGLLNGPQTISGTRVDELLSIKEMSKGQRAILKLRGELISGSPGYGLVYIRANNQNTLVTSFALDGQFHEISMDLPENAQGVRIYAAAEVNIYVQSLLLPNLFSLPYINFNINGSDHYLQNAYVAFIFLQRYYAFDMPAYQYLINGEQMSAYGVKRLKNQTLRFPIWNDPDLVQLVKTNLGNGTIEKLSVNLSSRNANATLKYDTE